MDRPKPAPRGSNLKGQSQRQDSASSESQDPDSQGVEEIKSPVQESPEKDKDKDKPKLKSSLKQRSKSHRPPSGPSTSSRQERLRNRPRDGILHTSVEDDDDLNTTDLRRQLERHERDLIRRDRELEEERQENERCMDRIKKLERDKVELKREVEGLKDEAEEYRRTLEDYKERTARARKGHPMTDTEAEDLDDINHNDKGFMSSGGSFDITLQQKNREIEQFIEDIEKLEEDKKSLQEKLTDLKDSLAEATKQIESMAQDHFNFKAKIQKSDERIKQLEEENTVISIRERDLLAFKNRHEQYLENLCNAVDIRVDVWKKMMFDKDEEIDRLNSKIAALMSQIPNTQMDSERSTIQQLNKKIGEREHHMSLLNEKLAQATEEIESNTKLIESLQAKLAFTEDTEKTEQLVKSLQSKLRKCEGKLEQKTKQLNSTEREAEEKSQELTSLLSRMNAYESGEYGLPEAVSEIKDLKVQIRIRDKQVEAVTQEINILQMQVNDLQDENEMLREKLGLERQADVSKETRRYTRSRKNELTALRSKVTQLEEEIIHLKTKNYSLKKQLNQCELTQQQPQPFNSVTSRTGSLIPERDRDRPDGGSVPSPKPGDLINHGDLILKGITGLGFRPEEWKEKYEIILEENTALRRGLHEILDCMHKMTDDGTAEVMIQAPVLEELLREMSARGIINYPYPISSFHMKVCNLEGKCSQLREELHRLRQEERQCRNELFEAQGIIKDLQTKLGEKAAASTETSESLQVLPRPKRPHRSRSRSPRSPPSRRSSSHSKKVTFDAHDLSRLEQEAFKEMTSDRRGSITIMIPGTGRNLILEDLHQEINFLRGQNDQLKDKFAEEKSFLESQLQAVIHKADELFNAKEGDTKSQLKIEFLQAIKENQANEIHSLIKKLAETENENTARLGFLDRFKAKALHQISTFQQILETSVPIQLLYTMKKEFRMLSEKLEELQTKEETFALKTIAFHKNVEEMAELRAERDRLEEDLGKCQARLLETAAQIDSSPEHGKISANVQSPIPPPRKESDGSGRSGVSIESQNSDLTQKLNHSIKMSNLLKSQLEEIETAKTHLESQVADLTEKYTVSVKLEQEAQEKAMNSIPREEYDAVASKLISTEETLVIAKDEVLKWKEIAEMTQNQIKAIENIKDFDKMEMDYLLKEVSELQSNSDEKALIAKAQRQLLTADKEKHLAIQQVQKLLSKLSQLEAHSLQQDKIHQEREMGLISMHTQVIMKYRSLFAALHDSNTPKYNFKTTGGVQSQEFREAFEMFERTLKRCSDLEEQILEERLKVEEFEQQCKTLESALDALRDGTGQEMVFDSVQKIQEARLEVARWKRKAEQKDRDCLTLRESVHRLEARATDLEEDRIRLEHAIEIKDSLTSALMAKSMDQIQGLTMETLSSTSIPILSSSSTGFDILHSNRPTEHKEVQTVSEMPQNMSQDQNILERMKRDNEILSDMLERLKARVAELEASLQGKDEVINQINFLRSQQEREVQRGPDESSDLQDALLVARESMTSLQDRLKSKDESVNQYRKLLADVRAEMTTATERHVLEMRSLQMTMHQQQQAFTRMKTTLSQPVKDTLNVEGTIKDQLTRIHELEDEISELQHTMGNVAAQLTAARSEAHRWRCHAENRGKEVDSAREQVSFESMEEINSLRQELKETHRRLEDTQQQLQSLRTGTQRDSMTELVNVLRNELDEKDKQIDAFTKSMHNLRNSAKTFEKGVLEEQLHEKDKEIMSLKDEIQQHHKTISSLQVKISKTKAANFKSGTTTELDDLKLKCRELMDDKIKLEKDLHEFQSKRDEDEQKRMKTAESVARWEESKKWKKNTEKLESRIKELENENEKAKRTSQNLRITITRLEKEKLSLDAKLKSKLNQNLREGSASSATYRFSDSSSMKSQAQSSENDQQQEQQQRILVAQGEIARLNMEIQDLKELCETTEFEGREKVEIQKMEIKLLKERITSQERQLTAYQIAQKGDPTAVAEIQNMAAREAQLQKEIQRLEEDNLHLNLQIEQLRLDTPRLRDRVQHLQRLVDALRAEDPRPGQNISTQGKSNSQKSLGELEKTINALKVVIEKLQSENKRLKSKPPAAIGLQPTASSERLKSSMENLLEEKKRLLDKVQSLEHENEKFKKRYHGSNSTVEALENRLVDAEKRAKSSEMKLRTFLGEQIPASSQASSVAVEQPINSSYEQLVLKMRSMQDELEHKGKLLSAAKQSLKEAERATAPKSYACSSTSSRRPQSEQLEEIG